MATGFSYRDLFRKEDERPIRDAETLRDMLVPITYEEARERTRRLTVKGPDHHPSTQRHFYICNRWDEETRMCTRYDERPEMCSAYPYDGECEMDGCDYTPPQDVIDKWLRKAGTV